MLFDRRIYGRPIAEQTILGYNKLHQSSVMNITCGSSIHTASHHSDVVRTTDHASSPPTRPSVRVVRRLLDTVAEPTQMNRCNGQTKDNINIRKTRSNELTECISIKLYMQPYLTTDTTGQHCSSGLGKGGGGAEATESRDGTAAVNSKRE